MDILREKGNAELDGGIKRVMSNAWEVRDIFLP